MGAFKRNLFIYFVKLTFFTTAFKNNRSTKNRDLTQFNKKNFRLVLRFTKTQYFFVQCTANCCSTHLILKLSLMQGCNTRKVNFCRVYSRTY